MGAKGGQPGAVQQATGGHVDKGASVRGAGFEAMAADVRKGVLPQATRSQKRGSAA